MDDDKHMFSEVRKRARKVGQAPGTPTYTGEKSTTPPLITVMTYNTTECKTYKGNKLDDCLPQQKFAGVTWVDIEGLHDVALIEQVAQRFNLHPLTIEDILNVDQRPKIEEFEGYVFITLKALIWQSTTRTYLIRQLSLVLGKDFVLSFQELDTSLFDALQTRISGDPKQRIRQQGSDYLTYRLIDIVVDQYFVVLESLGDQIEKVEQKIISTPGAKSPRKIYRLKRDMLMLRKAIWPMREALSHLMHGEEKLITKFTRVYLRDVYDHTVQAIDALETFRDMLSSMLDMYLSSLTNRMNEIMKTLTIIATIFIPITAIASIYGMNFEYMPGVTWRAGFAAIIAVMVAVAIFMLVYFRNKKWL